MAVLVFVPGISNSKSGPNNNQNIGSDGSQLQLLSIDYGRQNVSTFESNKTTLVDTEQLSISNDGSAKYVRSASKSGSGDTRQFTVSSDELSRLRSLITETGFMQIPSANYSQSNSMSNLNRYSLSITTSSRQATDVGGFPSPGENPKTFEWTDPSSTTVTVPPIIRNIGTQLDQLISGNQ